MQKLSIYEQNQQNKVFNFHEEKQNPARSNAWALTKLVKGARHHKQDENARIVTQALEALSHSQVARAMITEAARHGWNICLCDGTSYDFYLDVPEHCIVIDNHGLSATALRKSPYFMNEIYLSLAKALRDVWQEKRHGAFERTYDLESVLLLERIRAADLDCIAILVAWEIKNAGESTLWKHLLGSDEGDMALAFANIMERNPTQIKMTQALTMAFYQWHRDEDRINQCDHETLQYIDSIIQERRGQEILKTQKATPGMIELLSCLPNKTAYLMGEGCNIAHDPLFAGLCSDMNQAHFMQVLHDSRCVYAGGVAFRSAELAYKIFPQSSLLH